MRMKKEDCEKLNKAIKSGRENDRNKQLLFQASCAAMQGFISACDGRDVIMRGEADRVSQLSVHYASALLRELEREEKQ